MRYVIVFSGCMLVSAGLFWVGGYDFDYRGPDVADGAMFAFIMSAVASWAFAMCTEVI